MLLKSEINSDIGCVRANNEDMILFGGEFFRDRSAKQIFELSDTARFAAIVADGMGGHNGGEFAPSDASMISYSTCRKVWMKAKLLHP